jgi:chromosomal replication initiator protein
MNNLIFEKYTDEVCKIFEVNRDKLFTKTREKNVVEARQMLFYLCYTRPIGLNMIQSLTSNKGLDIAHTSILHGIRSMQKRRSISRDYNTVIERIENSVKL